MRASFLTIKLLACMVLLAVTHRAHAETAVVITRAAELPAVWKADQHLYVKGNPGLSAEALGKLESWLDQHAPHWTVVLAESADREQWRDETGISYSGMDAVEHALGRRLPAETGFGQWTHTESGRRDGAWLVIFLKERKFSYWAADLYDGNGLGEDQWQGNLDRPAIQAMRGGGRLADAVKDTITSIQTELERRLTAEAETRRQEKLRQERSAQQTGRVLADTRSLMQSLGAEAEKVRVSSPGSTGGLSRPPLASWEAEVDEAAAQLTQGNADQAAASLQALQQKLHGWQEAYAAFQSGAFEAVQQELDAMQLHPWSGEARGLLLQARQLLRTSLQEHADANEAYLPHLKESRQFLDRAQASDQETRLLADRHATSTRSVSGTRYEEASAQQHVTSAEDLLQRFPSERQDGKSAKNLLEGAASALEQARISHGTAVARKHALTLAGQAGGVGAGLVLGAAAFRGNRRRRPLRARAEKLLREWQEALRQKTDGLFALLDRTQSTIGTSATLDGSGWSGTTLELARQTIRDTDQLFVMSSALDQVVTEAGELVFPKNAMYRMANVVRGHRYEAALALLEEKPLAFGPETRIPEMLQAAPDQAGKGLLGKREDCEPFALTLPELNAAFNVRAGRALQTLDRIDTAWTETNAELAKLEQELQSATALEKEVNTEEERDGLLGINAVFATLLPSAQNRLAEAYALAANDPVQALEDLCRKVSATLTRAAGLCRAVLEFRRGALPQFLQQAEKLKTEGRRIEWSRHALEGLSAEIARLAEKSEFAPDDPDVAAWIKNCQALSQLGADTLQEWQRAGTTVPHQSQELRRKVAGTTQSLGEALGLPPEQILTEPNEDPRVSLEEVERLVSASTTAIDQGDPASAARSLDLAESTLLEAGEWVDQAQQNWSAHPQRMQQLREEAGRLSSNFPHHQEVLDGLRKQWSTQALLLPARPEDDSAPGTTMRIPLESQMQRAGAFLAEARSAMEAAEETFRQGRLLETGRWHARAQLAQEATAQAMESILKHRDVLEEAFQRNTRAAEVLDSRIEPLRRLVEEPVTMKPTRQLWQKVLEESVQAREAALATGTAADPLEAASDLEKVRQRLNRLEEQIQADRTAHHAATVAMAAAEHHLKAIEPLLLQARQDQIPDSPATAEAQERWASLNREQIAAAEALLRPHGDWPVLAREAAERSSAAAQCRLQLQGELEAAAATLDALQRANSGVRSATGWSGSMGVTLAGPAGTHLLDRAHEALNTGNYSASLHLAQQALREAQAAVEAAEAEERRRQREQERQEEARRRAAAARRSSTSSFGSGGSSGGGSQASRSGFSSGSGASRSGW